MIQACSEVVNHILPAVNDEDMVMDVKELVDKPHHRVCFGGLGSVTVLEFLPEEDYKLVLHPQLSIVEE